MVWKILLLYWKLVNLVAETKVLLGFVFAPKVDNSIRREDVSHPGAL